MDKLILAKIGLTIMQSDAVTDTLWMPDSNETVIELIFHHLNLTMDTGRTDEIINALNEYIATHG